MHGLSKHDVKALFEMIIYGQGTEVLYLGSVVSQ